MPTHMIISTVHRHRAVALLVAAVLLCLSTSASAAGDRTLRAVDGRKTDTGWIVELRFASPLRYMGHTPPNGAAESVQVELRTLGLQRTQESPVSGGETLRPFADGQGPPVLSLATMVSSDGQGIELEIRFSRKTPFEIRQGSDLQRLELLIPETNAAASPKYEVAAASLMTAANQSMAANDPKHAAQLYTRVLSMNAPNAHPEALEMLGLARERSGQRAHARAEYERFLERYPDHAHATRIRQRLQALNTASVTRPDQLAPARPRQERARVDVNGSLLSYYSRAQGFFGDDLGSRLYDSSWFSDLYLRTRLRTERIEFETSVSGRLRLDFRDEDVGADSRLNSLLVEVSERGLGWWGNVGRQRGDGGVIGRFDGARLGYRPNDRLDFQLLGGFPLASYSSDAINTDRFQVGGAAEALDIFSLVDTEVYVNYQHEASLTYRAALGAQFRHLRAGRTIVATLDYDAYFNVVNIATVLANQQLTDELSLNGLVEFRKSPIVTLGNALIGQTAGSIEELKNSFSDDEIKQLAKDRSSNAAVFSFGGRYDFNDRVDLSGTFSASNLGGTEASGGAPGFPGTGYDFGYYVQVGLRRLLMDRDITTFGLRLFDGKRYNRFMLEATGRYPVWSNLRINPIMRIEYFDADDDHFRLIPRLRLDYAWWELYFDLDFAYEWTRGVGQSERPTEHTYSLIFGLRYDF